tara:strand:+ start:1559 stop:2194 length:636 start_codon:yes stop_codon:yes gene_type:complete
MAYQSVWYFTSIPDKLIDALEEDLTNNFNHLLQPSQVGSGGTGAINRSIRNARNTWVPTSHWIGGFLWNYVDRANRENFLYDLDNIDGENLQYTIYGKGEYYSWHTDSSIDGHFKPEGSALSGITQNGVDNFVRSNSEKVRKLSFSLLLSNPDDYRGGNLELIDERGQRYVAPRQKGTIILFDSRTKHRVTSVTEGTRKSLVGWTIGPRWK